ncbi:alcohol dehydrogenase catalytic domain-containing protein [Lederbergia graminis]|uniref:Alcohol dehydrogenase catalytic domain-containing protein n=1 Tax=Lederbergia graminis TaxID=735518 RepID=A0ABW0LM76_9BACI
MDTAIKKMKVPVFNGNGQIQFTKKEIPQPASGQLLLEVKANVLCGSERGQFYHGSHVVPGHEVAGNVVAVGNNTSTEVGTPGVVFLMDYCSECENCQLGFTNQCSNKRGDYGFNRDGGYSPYIVVNENVFFQINPNIPLTDATLLLDIMGTGGHAIKRAQLVHQTIRSVAITGAGPIGLGVLAMSKLLLGKDIPVFIADYSAYRLQLAAKLGGIAVNLHESSLPNAIQSDNFIGVDAAFDTSGKTSARQSLLSILKQRGVLVCVGHGEELKLNVSSDLIANERAVLGSEYFQFEELAENLKLLQNNLAYLQQIITHRFHLEEIQAAFELFFKGDTGKVVIEHEG